MIKRLVLIPLLLPLMGIWSCGDTKTLRLTYSVASGGDSPDFIVIITRASGSDSFQQNVEPLPDGTTFYQDTDNLKYCAVRLDQIQEQTGFPASGSTNECASLGTFFGQRIFNAEREFTDPLSTGAVTLPELHNGFVFVLFFYNVLTSGASNRCFQIFASEIQNQKIVRYDSATGSRSYEDTALFSLGLVSGGVPQGGFTNCFTIP